MGGGIFLLVFRQVVVLGLAAAEPAAGFTAAFNHGVASGDPFAESIVLWTRVTPQVTLDAQVPRINATWRVWRQSEGESVIEQQGVQSTDGTVDWTIKLVVSGLAPATPYAFDFSVGPARSPSGRFKLPPPAHERLDALRYAVFSCSSWTWGYFTAFAAAARNAELDFWMHLGDYYYQTGQSDTYPAASQAVRWQGLQPPWETVTLSDYRLRHALHREDRDLQALSAAAPLIAIWDDHELDNDAWVGGAAEHRPEAEGDWWVRKRAAVKAYHEWMPTRIAPPPACDADADASAAGDACAGTHLGETLYRQFRFGTLASLFMLESRVLARAEQVTSGTAATREVEAIVGGTPPGAWEMSPALLSAIHALNASRHAASDGAQRKMLGAAQLEWLASGLANASGSGGATWSLIGQQVIVQTRNPPDLERAAASAADEAERASWQALLRKLAGANATRGSATGSAAADGADGEGGTTTVESFNGAAYASQQLGTQVPLTDAMVRHTRAMLAESTFGLSPEFDSWFGYPAARRRLLEALQAGGEASGGRVAVYAGDSHAAWAGRITTPEGAHVALEFDGTAATSSGFDSWLPYLPPRLLASAYVEATPTLEYANTHQRGWMAVTLTEESHTVSFMAVSTVGSRTEFSVTCDASFVQRAAAPHVLERRESCEDVEADYYDYSGAASHQRPEAGGGAGGSNGFAVALVGGAVGVLTTLALVCGLIFARSRRRAKPMVTRHTVDRL